MAKPSNDFEEDDDFGDTDEHYGMNIAGNNMQDQRPQAQSEVNKKKPVTGLN